ncbi:succinylglutamate desuccinylase/aspartoacylase family protein [Dactylosporangium roseum]|uniref:Succinylglutamate desuccinylase/aspartoacylase family protein n=1 Tax=Dactylosporangium roseum TaxID=47989 RepID=A0ABY5ZEZ9_9ACTN|nr:succinylglutamate desuccinylase/aspartoacylase family protein [Dactylosporangium roseum]UWZ39228.1 succinylglutamate desuccinylase/aspartoacylase family protein [Dactylosporangium roseum]
MQFEEKDWFEGTPGTKESFAIRLGEMPNGLPYLLPVMVLNGATDGPTFFVNAAMHGDEILGTEAVRQAWKLIETDQLRGRAVMIPMANLAGVGTRTRRNIIEMYPGPHDMNRVFPGNPKGIMTERIAATIIERFVKPAEYTFDIHCASVGGEWLPYVTVPTPSSEGLNAEQVRAANEMSRAWGTPLVIEGHVIPGSLVGEAFKLGKVAGMVEFGVANFSSREERVWGRTGVMNLLKGVGMLEGEPVIDREQITITTQTRILTDRGGFLHRRVETGAQVKEGESIAVLMSLDGEEIDEFKAPHAGVVCRMNTMGVVGTGDIIAYVGSGD